VKRLFKAVTAELEGRCDGIELSTQAYRLLLELQRDRRESYPAPVIRAMEHIQKHLDRNLPVGELAEAAGVSVSHLNRLFTEYLDISPMRYFRNQRMKWAADLIENTGLSVKEIAFRTGFENPGYFSHRFKDHFGTSPVGLRRK
jgi:transcriptional regulator GlxA family with amidase domain